MDKLGSQYLLARAKAARSACARAARAGRAASRRPRRIKDRDRFQVEGLRKQIYQAETLTNTRNVTVLQIACQGGWIAGDIDNLRRGDLRQVRANFLAQAVARRVEQDKTGRWRGPSRYVRRRKSRAVDCTARWGAVEVCARSAADARRGFDRRHLGKVAVRAKSPTPA